MHVLKKYKFFLLLGFPLIIEGLGIPYGRQIAYFLILSLPFLLLISTYFENGNIYFPKNIAFFLLLFIIISVFSLLMSVNLQRSFEYLLFYISCSLIMIYSYNNKREISENLPIFIIATSIIFCLYSIFIDKFAVFFPSITPTHGYQLVFAKFGSHNHLGDFLVLAITILIFELISTRLKIKSLLLLLFFIPFFIFSFSRSAYLDIVILSIFIITYIWKSRIKPVLTGIICLLIISLFSYILFFSTVKTTTLTNIKSYLFLNQGLANKDLTASRENYFSEAYISIIDKPLFGVGPSNFSYASTKFTKHPKLTTAMSHNLFLDILAENGLVAGLFFICMIFLIFKDFKLTFTGILAIMLLLNFQTNYTYKIMSLLLLFFVFMGILSNGKKKVNIGKFAFFSSVFLLICASLILLSNSLFMLDKSSKAVIAYPLNKEAIEVTINENNKPYTNSTLGYYIFLFKGDHTALAFAATKYEQSQNFEKALKYYLEASRVYPWDFAYIKKAYELKKNIEGEKNARLFLENAFLALSRRKQEDPTHDKFLFIDAMKYCQQIYNLNCPYEL